MAGLTGGEIGRFEIPGVVFTLCLAAGIGGGGMGLVGGFRQTFELGTQVGADFFEQAEFHLRTRRLARQQEVIKVRGVLTIYIYQKCGTCREAIKWLDARGISYHVKAIRETPPSLAELKTMLAAMGGDVRKLYNTSGVAYRELGMKDKLQTMHETDVLELLTTNGNLVKRPFLIANGKALVGFKEAEWLAVLGDFGKS